MSASAISSRPTPASASRWRRATASSATSCSRTPTSRCMPPRPPAARTFRFFEPAMDAQRPARRAARARPAPGARRRPVRALLPAAGRPRRQPGHRLRGAGALAPSRARHDLAGRVHPGRRGYRPDRPDRRMGAARRPAPRPRPGPSDIRLAVNVSPVQFKSGDAGAARSCAALAGSGLAPGRLELEITEAVLIRDDDAALAILHQLRALGVRIALDDFGTGYSSLSYLRAFRSTRSRSTAASSATSTSRRLVGDRAGGRQPRRRPQHDDHGGRRRDRDSSSSCCAQLGCTEMQGYLFSPAEAGRRDPEIVRRARQTPVGGSPNAIGAALATPIEFPFGNAGELSSAPPSSAASPAHRP